MEIRTVRGAEPINFNKRKPTQPLPQPAPISTFEKPNELPANLLDIDINKVPQKRNIFLLVILSYITLGIYSTIWYLKRVPEFVNLMTEKKMSRTLPLTLLIFDVIFIALLIIFPLTITIEIGDFGQNITTTQTILLLALGIIFLLRLFFSLLLAFYSRTIINQALEKKGHPEKISGFFTFIFTLFYLQYEINKINLDQEETSKKAPWTFFIIILLLAILGIALSFI